MCHHPVRSAVFVLAAVAGALHALPAAAADGRRDEVPAAAAEAGPRFDIMEYLVEGNSLLQDLAIEVALNPFLGERKAVADVEKARAALEKAYHDRGYLTVLVTIPEQKVDDGSVRLAVIEASVEKTTVKGADYNLPSAIKERVPELAANKVPDFNKVQQQLAQVNRSGGLKATPVLRAGSVPGTVEVQLDVDDRLPLYASVELNNRQTPNTTPTRLMSTLRYDNLWQRGHSASLTSQVAPERPEDARVLSGTYALPVGESGATLTMYGVASRSRFASLANAPGLGLLGDSNIFGARYTMPVAQGEGSLHTLTVGIDHKDLRQTLFIQAGGSIDSPIRYSPVMASYAANLFDAKRRTSIDTTLVTNLRGFVGDDEAAFNAKRSGASGSFFALRGTAVHAESIGGWTLAGKAALQLATGPLVPSEQMIAGGMDTVRGYLEGERAGDMGGNLSLELRAPAWAVDKRKQWKLSGLAFVDAASLVLLETAAGSRFRLAGAGIGLRLTGPAGLSLDADFGHAFTAGSVTAAGDKRLHARMAWNF